MTAQRYTTKTGRVISVGKVTRASHLVRTKQRRQEAPLPIELQVHPKALTPTRVHPGCKTSPAPYAGRALYLSQQLTRKDFLAGKALSPKPMRYKLTNKNNTLGYLPDLVEAMSWKYGAWMIEKLHIEIEDTIQ